LADEFKEKCDSSSVKNLIVRMMKLEQKRMSQKFRKILKLGTKNDQNNEKRRWIVGL
jgi:hypothetical protein